MTQKPLSERRGSHQHGHSGARVGANPESEIRVCAGTIRMTTASIRNSF
jgi:hypothetical protein